MNPQKLNAQQIAEMAPSLHAGDRILLSGTVYTARDAAHKRIMQCIEANTPLPFDLCGAVIYYAGPTPAPHGLAVGSCGPTTAGRMDPYTPKLLALGLAGMIGKGERNSQVVEAIQKHHAVYLCAIGGAGALACHCVKSCEEVAFLELGCESVKRLVIEDFPLIVGIDCHGGNLFQSA